MATMDEKSREPVSIAYYCTGHGYGHATRSIEVSLASDRVFYRSPRGPCTCAFIRSMAPSERQSLT